MRRAAKIGGGIVVLAAAGWSGLWLAGRGEVLARLELERDRLAAQGIEIAHGTPRVEGFPLAYRVDFAQVAFTDAARGLHLRLPQLTAEAGLGAPDRIVYRMPPRFELELERRDGDAAPPWRIEFETEAMVVEQRLSGGAPGALAVRADSLLAVHAAEGQALNAAVELGGLRADVDMPQAMRGAETALRLAVDSVDFLVTDVNDAGAATRLDGDVARLALTAASDQRSPAGIAAVLAGAPGGGRLAITLQTGAARLDGAVEGAEGGGVGLASGAFGGVFEIDAGRLALSGTSENNRVEITPAAGQAVPAGAAAIDRIETVYRSPLAPAEAMDELAFRLALGRITPDERLWQAIDPEGALQRAPGEIVIDLAGSARMLANESGRRPVDAELGSLTLRHADVALFGASAALRGEVEFVQPANRPTGRLTLTLTRSMDLVGELVRAGLIDIGVAQAVTGLAANYTRPGDAPESLVAEIAFEHGEARINGDPAWIFDGAPE